MIIAHTSHGYGHLIMDAKGLPIAVITPRMNEKKCDITFRVNQALSEHYNKKLVVRTFLNEEMYLTNYNDSIEFYAEAEGVETYIPFKIVRIILYLA